MSRTGYTFDMSCTSSSHTHPSPIPALSAPAPIPQFTDYRDPAGADARTARVGRSRGRRHGLVQNSKTKPSVKPNISAARSSKGSSSAFLFATAGHGHGGPAKDDDKGLDMDPELAKRKAREDLKLGAESKKPKMDLGLGAEQLESESECGGAGANGGPSPMKFEKKDFSSLPINPHCLEEAGASAGDPGTIGPSGAMAMPVPKLGPQVLYRVCDFSYDPTAVPPPVRPGPFPGWINLDSFGIYWTRDEAYDPDLPSVQLSIQITCPLNQELLETEAKKQLDWYNQRQAEIVERAKEHLKHEWVTAAAGPADANGDESGSDSEPNLNGNDDDEDDENDADNWRNEYPDTDEGSGDSDGGYLYGGYNRDRKESSSSSSSPSEYDEYEGDPAGPEEIAQLNAHFASMEWEEEQVEGGLGLGAGGTASILHLCGGGAGAGAGAGGRVAVVTPSGIPIANVSANGAQPQDEQEEPEATGACEALAKP